MNQSIIKVGKVAMVVLAIPIVLYLMVVTVSLAHATNDKQVYCNVAGESGQVKAKMSDGNTEHEYKLDGVFVHDQQDVTKAMDKQCEDLIASDVCSNIYGVQLTVPEGKELKDGKCLDKAVVVDEPDEDTDTGKEEPKTPVVESTPTTPVIEEEVEVFYGK